jgi:uncharacterized membrane protein YdjX (TVP38/TMEM64 family)/rhodanese-related sulfurtransferase
MKDKAKRLLLLLALLSAIVLAARYREQFNAESLQAWIEAAGAAAPLLFMLLYAAATVLFLPGSVLTLAGGAIFGPLWGTLYSLTGATVGATLAFLVSRYLASQWVEQKVGGRLARLKQGVEAEGWRFVAFVRLVPLFPFNALNYALGLTRIRLLHYVLASYLFMLPGAFAYTYLGYAGREALSGGQGLIQKVLLALALLALVMFLPRLIGRLRRGAPLTVAQLQQRVSDGARPVLLDVRSVEAFAEKGHVDGAINIPLEQLPVQIDELALHRQALLAVIAVDEEARAQDASRQLAGQGYSEVHVVQGSLADWAAAGYPVAS